MDFSWEPEQEHFRAEVCAFVERQLAPHYAADDRAARMRPELPRQLAGMGLTGLRIPEELGGQGADAVTTVLATEEIARADLTGATLTSANLAGAILTGTWLNGADLATAKGLIEEQLDSAHGDDRTVLPASPSELRRPAHWPAGLAPPPAADR